MTSPTPTYRVVAGLRVPLPLIPRIIPAMQATYPEATAGVTDPDRIVRLALRAWVRETLAEYEEAEALAPLGMTVAQTVTAYEAKATDAKAKAYTDSEAIVDDVATTP